MNKQGLKRLATNGSLENKMPRWQCPSWRQEGLLRQRPHLMKKAHGWSKVNRLSEPHSFEHPLRTILHAHNQSSGYDLASQGWGRCWKCADHVDLECMVSLTVISLCKLADELHVGREFAEHLCFVYLSAYDSYSPFKINRLALHRKRKCWSHRLWMFRSLSHSFLFAN